MRASGIRSTHAGLVGGALGPLLVVAAVGPALPRIEGGWSRLGGALGAGLLLALVSWAGVQVVKRLERDRPAPALTVWTGISLALAGLACSLYGGRTGGTRLALASIPIGAAVAALGLVGRTRERPRAPRTQFGAPLLALAIVATAAPFWPSWLPWLRVDQNLPEVGYWPPNFLFVALGAPETSQEALPGSTSAVFQVLRAEAVSYLNLTPEPKVASLLTLPDGRLVGAQLYAAGYATAAIGAVPDGLRELGIAEVDDRPGGRRLLEEPAAWMAGAPLLVGSGLLGLLGHDRPIRSAEQLGDEAARWLLGWRTTRAPAPFFLFVDFRAPGADATAIDVGLRRILDPLQQLLLDSVTLLVLAVETPASAASRPALGVLVVLPSSWEHEPRLEVAATVWGRALCQSLLEIALSNGKAPLHLPGLSQELTPPKLP
jgi:hypothetical protein